MVTLPKAEKIAIIEARMRSLEYKKYGLEVDLLVENAKNLPSTEAVATVNEALEELENQLSVLNSELTTVNALEE